MQNTCCSLQEFSDQAVFTGPLPCFSPDGKHIALAQDYRLVVRDVETLAVVSLFSCLDQIDAISWSPCGELILCGMYKRGTAQVFTLADSEWSSTITEALAGIVCARWCPSAEDVLLISDFQIKMSVWSLLDQSCHTLPAPKHSEAGAAFSPDGSLFAVLERIECKDFFSVYDTASWAMISRTPLPTIDAADLSWSPDGACIVCWDGAAQGPLLCVVSPEGDILATHTGFDTSNHGVNTHSVYGLGLKSVAWSPSGQLLAVGSYDQDASVLNNVTWGPLAGFTHPSVVDGPASVVVYKEEILPTSSKGKENITGGSGGGGGSTTSRMNTKTRVPEKEQHSQSQQQQRKPPVPTRKSLLQKSNASLASMINNPSTNLSDPMLLPESDSISRFIIADLPTKISLPGVRPPTDRPNPKLGIGLATWSANGYYLATRSDDRPNLLWIWDSSKLELASVVEFVAGVRAAAWAPGAGIPRLAVVCGTGKVYFWMPEGVSSVHVPVEGGMRATSVQWCRGGEALMVASKDTLVCAYTLAVP